MAQKISLGEKKNFHLEENKIIKMLIMEQTASLSKAILELIQNSIDACKLKFAIPNKPIYDLENLIKLSASNIHIKISKKKIFVWDNGVGMDLEKWLNVGSSEKEEEMKKKGIEQIGKFGVGHLQALRHGSVFIKSRNKILRASMEEEITIYLEEIDKMQPSFDGFFIQIDLKKKLTDNDFQILKDELQKSVHVINAFPFINLTIVDYVETKQTDPVTRKVTILENEKVVEEAIIGEKDKFEPVKSLRFFTLKDESNIDVNYSMKVWYKKEKLSEKNMIRYYQNNIFISEEISRLGHDISFIVELTGYKLTLSRDKINAHVSTKITRILYFSLFELMKKGKVDQITQGDLVEFIYADIFDYAKMGDVLMALKDVIFVNFYNINTKLSTLVDNFGEEVLYFDENTEEAYFSQAYNKGEKSILKINHEVEIVYFFRRALPNSKFVKASETKRGQKFFQNGTFDIEVPLIAIVEVFQEKILFESCMYLVYLNYLISKQLNLAIRTLEFHISDDNYLAYTNGKIIVIRLDPAKKRLFKTKEGTIQNDISAWLMCWISTLIHEYAHNDRDTRKILDHSQFFYQNYHDFSKKVFTYIAIDAPELMQTANPILSIFKSINVKTWLKNDPNGLSNEIKLRLLNQEYKYLPPKEIHRNSSNLIKIIEQENEERQSKNEKVQGMQTAITKTPTTIMAEATKKSTKGTKKSTKGTKKSTKGTKKSTKGTKKSTKGTKTTKKETEILNPIELKL